MKLASMFRIFFTVVALMVVTTGANAELMVGDKAPKLETGQWVQGDPVSGFDSNHVYLVEFWATWCGPCVQSIPHLNQIWQKFKDENVIAIGVDVWDSDKSVTSFVKKMGTNMTYRVALDDKSQSQDGFMAANWWPRKVNHHGIPTAFIINRDGIIAWIGHPMGLNEEILEEIASGHQDMAKAKLDYQKNQKTEMKFQDLQETLNASIDKKNWDAAQSALDQIDLLLPRMTNGFSFQRLKIFIGRKKFDEAYQFADSLSNIHSTNYYWLNTLAQTIGTSDNPDTRCLQLAEKMADRGLDMENGNDVGALDALSRIQFMLGRKEEAIATEKKAENLASDLKEKGFLEINLLSYRQGKLPDAAE